MKRLRFERTSRELSQTAVSTSTGLAQWVISFTEIGRHEPTDDELQRLSDFFGVPPADLLKDVEVVR